MKTKISDYFVLLLGGASMVISIIVFQEIYEIIKSMIKYKEPIKDVIDLLVESFIQNTSLDSKILLAIIILLIIGCLINIHYSVHYMRHDNAKTKLHFMGLIFTLIFCIYYNYQEIKTLIDFNINTTNKMAYSSTYYMSMDSEYKETVRKSYYESIFISILVDGVVIINIILLMTYNEEDSGNNNLIITDSELEEARRLMNTPSPNNNGVLSYIPVGEEGNSKPLTPPMPRPIDIPESEVVIHKPEPIVEESSQELVNKVNIESNEKPVVVMEAIPENNNQLPPPIEEHHEEAVLPTIQ